MLVVFGGIDAKFGFAGFCFEITTLPGIIFVVLAVV